MSNPLGEGFVYYYIHIHIVGSCLNVAKLSCAYTVQVHINIHVLAKSYM